MKDFGRRAMIHAILLAAAGLLGACAHGPMHHRGMSHGGSAIYWCDCGADCSCGGASVAPGKCSCGKEMTGGHVVFTDGNVALACACGTQCSCKIDPDDHGRCGCGKPVKRINLTETGIYFCNCGGSCGCNTISAKPGTCRCGMPLHQAK